MSSTQLDADIRLVLSADDRMSQPVKDAVDRVNRQYRDFNSQSRALTRSFQLQHRTFSSVSRAISDVGRVAGTTTHIFNSFNLMQIRQAETTRNLRDAQEDLNKAVAEYGPRSEQARMASRKLADERAQAAQQRTQDILQYATIGVQGAGAIGSFTRSQTFGKLAGRLGAFGGGAALSGALGGLRAGAPSLLSRALPVAGPAAGIAAGGILGTSLHESNPIPGPFGDIGRGIESFFNEKLGLGGGNKTVNVTNHINTNEIGVTVDDIVNSSDVFG